MDPLKQKQYDLERELETKMLCMNCKYYITYASQGIRTIGGTCRAEEGSAVRIVHMPFDSCLCFDKKAGEKS